MNDRTSQNAEFASRTFRIGPDTLPAGSTRFTLIRRRSSPGAEESEYLEWACVSALAAGQAAATRSRFSQGAREGWNAAERLWWNSQSCCVHGCLVDLRSLGLCQSLRGVELQRGFWVWCIAYASELA